MNPRGRKHEKPGGGPRFRFGSPLLYLGLVVLGLVLFRNMFQEAGYLRVPYSAFKQAVREGRFKRVQIGPDVLRGYTSEVIGQPARNVDPTTSPWTSNRVEDPELTRLLDEKKIEYEAIPGSGLGESFWIWVLPLLLGFVFWTWVMRRMGAGGLGQGPQSVMSFGKTRARVQAEADTGVGFDDVAGIDEAVDELREIVEFLRTPEKFRKLGGRIPKGVLLVGPPGTGKTLLAQAVAGEAGVPFFSLSGSEFVEMFVGVGAARVRDLFAQAQAKAPCIIFIDELDAIGKTRSAGAVGGHDEREQTLNQMLAEMDGFDARAGLIIIAATNRPEILDSALLRPGRFDRQVLVDRPDKRGRERILAIHAREVKLGPDVDLRSIAARTPGFAGADLANVVNEAALLAARRDHTAVLRTDFEEAIERVVAGLEKKNRRISEREKEIVAHHEAGHAVVGWLLPHTEPVHKISIIPRGLSALGYTMSLPLEDRYLMSLDELRDKMAAMMGGRAAEELFIGEISTGASNDLKQATDIARLMVRDYGMSGEVGPVSLAEQGSAFLQSAALPEMRSYSEKTARMVDAEIRRLTLEALERARSVLRANRALVEAVAARLLATEVVEEPELVRILGPKVTPARAADPDEPAEAMGAWGESHA
ncbi:MAG: ATP-dependent metallopeptidase FtsH/Yme1/Tma family protein [Myxococcaceae bacterium]|nr:MAG: ATP-dependent metallopeptidase FtsH/Yme1/Tma family protein [Myxococcaceae bacterium]